MVQFIDRRGNSFCWESRIIFECITCHENKIRTSSYCCHPTHLNDQSMWETLPWEKDHQQLWEKIKSHSILSFIFGPKHLSYSSWWCLLSVPFVQAISISTKQKSLSLCHGFLHLTILTMLVGCQFIYVICFNYKKPIQSFSHHFSEGHFVVAKSKRAFSSLGIDHAHQQNSKCVKGDGGMFVF